jgi:hypothetical protein
MIELLTMLPFALLCFYFVDKIDSAYEDSEFLIKKANRHADGEKWDRKEF